MLSFLKGSEVQEEDKASALKHLIKNISGSDVEASLRSGGEQGLQDKGGLEALLLRFLRAEKYNVPKAEKRLREHAEWRKVFFLNGSISEEEIKNELAAQKVFVQGCDKFGRGIIILLTARHSKSTRDLDETKRLICYSLEQQIQLHDAVRNPDGKGIGIFDMRGIGMDCLDAGALRAVFDLLQNHYPERLGALYMYEAPTIFWALWHAVSPFIDPETKKKVIFVYGSSGAKEIQSIISPEVLPTEFGGTAELIPAEKAVAQFKGSTKAQIQNGGLIS
ncbi:CRAL/TRIO domain-containing protein [Coccomyxa subellipsoidea C-169]|uniref:CRAL/TRIO domain-containing protein n=1 Tax=Coccomyxa subellipsoidea (strain C-169) TaxID=574566 RepID=I0Z5M5_COCSC|nr:CRAL/TRIO domain-containing protein [Coccomyxa subellipsoidea C-169]EIE25944.1 CRAL/TRIO domain-containing protein [Coccomyxa subellipsoidea C-169]|eukprot:XP_005650488.1 CRAL/TRIO domain-containing protein [Coccomyxa subellipsoidea C-169]